MGVNFSCGSIAGGIFLEPYSYRKLAHKPYIAVIFKNMFFHRTLSMEIYFRNKQKITLRRETTTSKNNFLQKTVISFESSPQN